MEITAKEEGEKSHIQECVDIIIFQILGQEGKAFIGCQRDLPIDLILHSVLQI